MTRALVVAVALIAASCAAPAPPVAAVAPVPPREVRTPTGPGQRNLALIMSFMPGTFESIAQLQGPGVGTRMRIAQFWTDLEKSGEFWFYVEHTKVADDQRPFRQRIYRFTESNGKFSGDVFALPGKPRDFIGEWRKAKPFERFKPAVLREFEGCRLAMGQMTMIFWARTEGKACRAENSAAAHEFSEMLGSSVGMKNGEHGYDPAGRQIAGETGVWDFRRISREPR